MGDKLISQQITQPVGIIKTMPQSWVKRLPGGFKKWEKTFLKMNVIEGYYWTFNLSGKPKYEVLYFYLLINGAIRYRCNIINYEGAKVVDCYTGEKKHGRCWVNVSAPVIKLKNHIPMKGFQGFRYTDKIYS